MGCVQIRWVGGVAEEAVEITSAWCHTVGYSNNELHLISFSPARQTAAVYQLALHLEKIKKLNCILTS